jgi:glutamyl-tRNA reductase
VSVKDNNFSSKPKQIAQAAIQVLKKVFGSLEDISLIVMSDMKLPINIAENIKKSNLRKYKAIKESANKFVVLKGSNQNNYEKLINLLIKYDMVMIGYKDEFNLVDIRLAKQILKKRKQRPVFFVDCGIPGNINNDVGKIDNCFLFDLNDLEQLYSSWKQEKLTNEYNEMELYDFELKGLLDSFFKKLNFNLKQKMIFEKHLDVLLRSNKNAIKASLKDLLKTF